jgi:hypothetical protein
MRKINAFLSTTSLTTNEMTQTTLSTSLMTNTLKVSNFSCDNAKDKCIFVSDKLDEKQNDANNALNVIDDEHLGNFKLFLR